MYRIIFFEDILNFIWVISLFLNPSRAKSKGKKTVFPHSYRLTCSYIITDIINIFISDVNIGTP